MVGFPLLFFSKSPHPLIKVWSFEYPISLPALLAPHDRPRPGVLRTLLVCNFCADLVFSFVEENCPRVFFFLFDSLGAVRLTCFTVPREHFPPPEDDLPPRRPYWVFPTSPRGLKDYLRTQKFLLYPCCRLFSEYFGDLVTLNALGRAILPCSGDPFGTLL